MVVRCNQKKGNIRQRNGNGQNIGNTSNFRNSSRNANEVQLVDQDEYDEELDDVMIVIQIEGDRESAKPFYRQSFKNGQKFKTMVDSGSPFTIFALDEIKQAMKRKELQVISVIESENS